jgi:hypothetical protein
MNLMKNTITVKIKILKPKKDSEKISRKNPPKKAEKKPELFSGFSKKLMRITEIKMRFGLQPTHHPKMLK